MTTSPYKLATNSLSILVLLEQLVTSLITVIKLVTRRYNNLFHKNWEQAMRTHPDNGLTTTLFVTTCLRILNLVPRVSPYVPKKDPGYEVGVFFACT